MQSCVYIAYQVEVKRIAAYQLPVHRHTVERIYHSNEMGILKVLRYGCGRRVSPVQTLYLLTVYKSSQLVVYD